MFYIVGILAVIVAIVFWYTQKVSREQAAWKEQKLRDIEAKRARIAARKEAEDEDDA